jgi:hypothetical protein
MKLVNKKFNKNFYSPFLFLGLYLIFITTTLFYRAILLGSLNIYIQYSNLALIILFCGFSVYNIFLRNKNPVWVLSSLVLILSVYLQYLLSNLTLVDLEVSQKLLSQRYVRDLFLVFVAVVLLVKNRQKLSYFKTFNLPTLVCLIFFFIQIFYFFVSLLIRN